MRAEQRHIAPPGKLGQRELELHGDRYGESVAQWCEAQMGTQVGNGECWTLANEGLKAVAQDCRERGEEACMNSQGYVHGYKVFEFKNGRVEVGGGVREAGVRRGDVVQFLEAHFRDSRGGQKWAGAPDHTSVVVGGEFSFLAFLLTLCSLPFLHSYFYFYFFLSSSALFY